MVKVDPPDGWAPPAANDSAGDAGAHAAGGRAAQFRAGEVGSPPPADSGSADSLAGNTFDDALDLLSGKQVAANERAPTTAGTTSRQRPATPPDRKVAPPPRADEGAIPLPNASWTSESSRKRLFVGAAVAIVLLLTVAAFAIGRAIMSGGDPPNRVAAPGEAIPLVESQPEQARTGQPVDHGEPTAVVDPGAKEEVVDTSDASVGDAAPTDPLSTVAQDTIAEAGPIEKADSVSSSSPGPPGLVDKHSAGPSATEEFNGLSLLAELETFGDLLDDPTLSDDAAGDEGVEDVLEPGEVADEDSALPRPEKREVDVAERLKDPLLGIELNDVSLSVFIRFVSDFSTMPISFDPVALEQRQVTARTTVSIRRTDTTIGELLSDVFSPLGLEYVETDGQLIIVAASSKADSWREATYDVADLASGSPAELKWIADGITSMIVPKSWEVHGGSGTLTTVDDDLAVRHDEAVHFQVLKLCDKLRVARGLSPRSEYPAELFRLEPRATLAREALKRQVSMNYLEAVRFVEIIERTEQQTETSILVDWLALAQAGWNPDASFPYSVDAEPLHKMLDGLLTQMGLMYRIVNEDTIQITTPARLLNLAEIEFYPVSHLLSDELSWQQLVAGVRATVGEVYFLDHAGAIHFDPQSNCLIVALPQPQQVRIASILAGLGESDRPAE